MRRWHLTTVAFLSVGSALVLAGSVLDGDAAQRGWPGSPPARPPASRRSSWGSALPTMRSPRNLFRHPGPAVLTATAALAWWGAL